jgi:hypothetical protein
MTVDSSADYRHTLDRRLNMPAPIESGAETVSISRRILFASLGLILPAIAFTVVGAKAATTTASHHHHHAAKHAATKAHTSKHLAASHHHHRKAVTRAAS